MVEGEHGVQSAMEAQCNGKCSPEDNLISDCESDRSEGSVVFAHLQQAGGILKKRNIISFMLCMGLANVYAMRVNLSLAVEPMQKHYGWSNVTQGYVLSAFFWGYIVFQIPGGILASRFGGKRVFGLGVLGTALLTLVLPLCASNLGLLFTVRALMGLFESVTYPALNVLYTEWVPCTERSFHVGLTTAGAYLGTAIAFPVSGALIDISKDGNDVSTSWPLVFYVFGAAGVTWAFAWEMIGASTPAQCRGISKEERRYIEATTKEDADVTVQKLSVKKSPSPPWRGFLTNSAAWAIYLNHFGSNFCIYTLMTYLPKYLDEELGFSLKNAGGIAIIPYVLQFVGGCAAGVLADKLVQFMTVRNTRLAVELFCFTVTGSLLIATGWMTKTTLAITTVSLAIGFSGMISGGYSSNYIDVSPHYAGVLFSCGNLVANIAGILAPIITGYVLGDPVKDSTPTLLPPLDSLSDSSSGSGTVPSSHWRHVFYLSAAVYAAAGVIWILFMKGKPVPELN